MLRSPPLPHLTSPACLVRGAMGVQASSQKKEKEDLSRRRYEQNVTRDGELRCMGGAFVPLVCSGELPCVRSGHDCVVIGHRAYLFGGYDGKG